MNNFTKGTPNVVNGKLKNKKMHQVCGHIIFKNEIPYADVELIQISFTTATKLANQGYDAQKVIELLPELLTIFDDRYLDVGKSIEVWEWLDGVTLED